MSRHIKINGCKIGPGEPVYIIAEMSANHNQDFDQAVKIIEGAKESGADAVKLQTYTPDTMTVDVKNEYFRIKGSPWDGQTLYELYGEAHTPWDWQPKLKSIANNIGLDFFSTAFDSKSVEFLEELNIPVHKIASFEIVDIPLIEKMAETGKPLIISTGMASLGEIEDAVQAARNAGATQIALLKCTSAYPAPPEEINLRTIPHLRDAFGVPVGLSDHTLGSTVPVGAVALGACIVEKHFTLSRGFPGPDSSFSMEPQEFREMVNAIRLVEKSLGKVNYGATGSEKASQVFRRSLFAVEHIKAGEEFNLNNVRSIRPGFGLPPKYLKDLLGRRAATYVKRGTPLSWDKIFL